MGCVFQDYPRRKSILQEEEKIGIEPQRQLLQGHMARKKFGKERVHRKELCKNANLKIAIRLRQQSRTGHFRKLCHKNDAPAEKHGTWRTMSLSSKHKDEAPFDSPSEAWVMKAPSSKKPQTREFVIDSGASMHTLSNKDSSSGELETLRRSRNPTTVVIASGEVQTNEEAQVYVHDLGLFVTVHLLEDTRAVVSLGKLCEEHGYNPRVGQWSKATPDQRWEENSIQDGKVRACCCPRIVVKLQRKFVFCAITTGFIKFFDSSKFTK